MLPYFTQNMAKSRYLITSCFLILTLFALQGTKAQGLFTPRQILNQYTTMGLGFGSSHYSGDLTMNMKRYPQFLLYKNVRWNIHGHYTRYITPNSALRLQFSWIRLLGNDNRYSTDSKGVLVDGMDAQYLRNLHFRNDLKEMTLSGIFNLIPNYAKSSSRDRLKFTPYFTIGAGLVSHQPKAKRPMVFGTEKLKYDVNLRDLGTSGQNLPNATEKVYSLVVPVIPIGLGMRWKVNNKIDLSLEGNIRYTFSDYLDDVGYGPYPDQAQLSSYNPESAIFSFRAYEAFNSVTGDNRVTNDNIRGIYATKTGNVATPGTPLDQMIREIGYEPTTLGVLRGGSRRNDLYGTIQFTVSYIISEKIKCPVPR